MVRERGLFSFSFSPAVKLTDKERAALKSEFLQLCAFRRLSEREATTRLREVKTQKELASFLSATTTPRDPRAFDELIAARFHEGSLSSARCMVCGHATHSSVIRTVGKAARGDG